MRSIPQHKKNCGIRVGSDLFKLVSVLDYGSNMVRGRVQFGNLLLKTNHINT